MLLHAGFIHLAVNVLIQLRVGVMLELDWGFKRFSVIYLVSGLTSSLLSCLALPDTLGVGYARSPTYHLKGLRLSLQHSSKSALNQLPCFLLLIFYDLFEYALELAVLGTNSSSDFLSAQVIISLPSGPQEPSWEFWVLGSLKYVANGLRPPLKNCHR